MRKTKWFASVALAAGLMVAGTTAASAQDWRDVRHDYNRVEMLRNQVARDRARLAEDMRYGDRREIRRDRAMLNRHEADLRAAMRETRWDGRGAYNNSNSFYNGFRR